MDKEGLIYTAPPLTWKSSFLSIITLSSIFLFALFYVPLVLVLLYFYAWSMYFWLVVVILCSTPWWHKVVQMNDIHYWRNNRVFEAWRAYFGLRIYEEKGCSPLCPEGAMGGNKIIYTFVPHGLFPFGLTLISGVLFKDKGVKIGIASNMFYIPVFGLLLRLLGCVEADKNLFKNSGSSIVIIPDGIAGAFHSDRTHEVLYLRERKGFVREAIAHGYTAIVPVYCFGHTQLYDVYGWKEMSRRLRFALIGFWGRKPAIWLPHARVVSVVFGVPIPIVITDDCKASVENIHWNYLKSIKDLYDKYKSIVLDWDKKKELKII